MSRAVTLCCSSESLRTEECIQSKDIKCIVLVCCKGNNSDNLHTNNISQSLQSAFARICSELSCQSDPELTKSRRTRKTSTKMNKIDRLVVLT